MCLYGTQVYHPDLLHDKNSYLPYPDKYPDPRPYNYYYIIHGQCRVYKCIPHIITYRFNSGIKLVKYKSTPV